MGVSSSVPERSRTVLAEPVKLNDTAFKALFVAA
jgi:hypothetical protein